MSKQNPNPLNLDTFLPYRLSVVTNKISRALADLYSDQFDLTIPEWRIMAVMGQHPDLSADEVCVKTEMDKVTVSRAVTKLLNKKKITRRFSSEDRRRSILNLSKSGYAAYCKIAPMALEFEKQLVKSLGKNEREAIAALLDKLESRVGHLENKVHTS